MTGFLLTLFRILLFLILAVFVASFITSNTAMVTLGLFPLPYTLEMPLYALGLGMLFFGLISGGMIVSTAHVAQTLRLRKQKKSAEQKTAAAENELQALRAERDIKHTPNAVQSLLPPLAK